MLSLFERLYALAWVKWSVAFDEVVPEYMLAGVFANGEYGVKFKS
jgi:hypothetical protein